MKIRRVIVIVALLVAVAAMVSVSLAIYWHGNEGLPRIANPARLQRDCASLYQQFPFSEDKANFVAPGFYERQIPTNAWPASVRALHPFKVTDDKYGIYIWILHDSRLPQWDVGSRGYFIHLNPHLTPPRFAHSGSFGGRFELHVSSYDEIDIFYQPGAYL